MEKYLAAWASLDWLNQKRLKRILYHFGDLQTAWENISQGDLTYIQESERSIQLFLKKKEKISPEEEYEKLKKHNIQLCYYYGSQYPQRLKAIIDAPVFLYMQGKWQSQHELSLAVVGTRTPSHYGKRVTESFVYELGQQLTIVSGLALGVDSLAHQACVKHNYQTVAVLGNGLDSIYPRNNKKLAEQILETGGIILSEFPLGTEPNNYNFPRRNRIISGLSLGVLIIEGKLKSGSLITARLALDQNKEVFAVPGSIYSTQSLGTNFLIQQGEAKLVSKVEDIFEELSLDSEVFYKKTQKTFKLSEEEEELYKALGEEAIDISQICSITNFDSIKISSLLTLMEMKGMVKNIGSALWVKKSF